MKTLKCNACGIEGEAREKCPVCGTPAATEADRLTRAVTAFESWGEMRAAMEGGYCPTLRPAEKARGRRQREWNDAVARLAQVVRQAGFKVYDGKRVG